MEKFSLDRDWKFYNGDFELPETKTHTEMLYGSQSRRCNRCGVTGF